MQGRSRPRTSSDPPPPQYGASATPWAYQAVKMSRASELRLAAPFVDSAIPRHQYRSITVPKSLVRASALLSLLRSDAGRSVGGHVRHLRITDEPAHSHLVPTVITEVGVAALAITQRCLAACPHLQSLTVCTASFWVIARKSHQHWFGRVDPPSPDAPEARRVIDMATVLELMQVLGKLSAMTLIRPPVPKIFNFVATAASNLTTLDLFEVAWDARDATALLNPAPLSSLQHLALSSSAVRIEHLLFLTSAAASSGSLYRLCLGPDLKVVADSHDDLAVVFFKLRDISVADAHLCVEGLPNNTPLFDSVISGCQGIEQLLLIPPRNGHTFETEPRNARMLFSASLFDGVTALASLDRVVLGAGTARTARPEGARFLDPTDLVRAVAAGKLPALASVTLLDMHLTDHQQSIIESALQNLLPDVEVTFADWEPQDEDLDGTYVPPSQEANGPPIAPEGQRAAGHGWDADIDALIDAMEDELSEHDEDADWQIEVEAGFDREAGSFID